MSSNTLSYSIFHSVFQKSGLTLLLDADNNFEVVAASDQYVELLSQVAQPITGKNLPDIDTGLFDQADLSASLNTAMYGQSSSFYSGEWLVSHQPISAEDGKVTHILHTLTRQVTSRGTQGDERFEKLVMQAPVAIGLLRGRDLIVETANASILDIWGKTEAIIGLPLEIALPELEGQPFVALLRHVLQTGEPHYGYEAMAMLERNQRIDPYYFNFVYYPLEENGVYNSVMVVANEVTQQVRAGNILKESERQFSNLVMQAPVAIGIMRGEDLVIDLYNKELLKIWGREEHEVKNQKLLDVFPELKEQHFPQLLLQVYQTGIPYKGEETPAVILTNKGLVKYWFNFIYEPLFEIDGSVSGIILMIYNITEQVEARHKLARAEERLRLATEATGLGTYDLDLKTDHIFYSPRLAEIFGFDNHAAITHANLRARVHYDDLPAVDAAYQRALQTGIYFYEVRIVWDNRTLHWVRTQGNLIFDQNNQPERLVGTVLDVTSQRHIINELINSEENLRMATEAAELGTFNWNIPEDKLTWDIRARELFGVFDNKPVTYQDTFVKGLHQDDLERVTYAINQSLDRSKTGGDYDVDYRTIGLQDHKLRWIRAKGKAFFNEQNEAVRLIGTIVDITDRKSDEIRKNDFIAMASHELKTPLTSLKAYIQMLLGKARNSDDQFFSNSLEKANNQVDKMTKLIYGFLDLSKIESGKLHLDLQQFDINDAVNEAITDVRPVAQGHKIIFEPTGKTTVNADREKISQVIINLINNAVKYSPKGTEIIVSVKEDHDCVEVNVLDQGIGINEIDRDKIFQRFYRVQDEKMKSFSGFGIGLYLSSEIINLHQGKIGVESRYEQGSRFYFSLPKLK